MAAPPWNFGPQGERDPRAGHKDPTTAEIGGAGFDFNMPGLDAPVENTNTLGWFDWRNLQGTGQANVPKGGVGVSASFGGGAGGSGGASSSPSASAPTAGNPSAGMFDKAGMAGNAASKGGTVAAGSWYTNPNLWGAVLGAGSSYLDAEAAKKASKNAGRVDITSERSPWEPGESYILDALARGKSLMDQGGGVRQPSQGGGGGGGARVGQQPVTYRSAQNADALTARASSGHPLYGASNQYVAGTLSGDGADANRYRDEAATMFGDLSDPNLNAFISALSGGGRIGGGTATGGGGMSASYVRAPESGAGVGPVGAAQYIKDILDEKYLKENPHSQAVIEAANRRVMDDFAATKIPGVNTKYAGAGALGSEAWNEALRRSTGAVTDSLADNASSVLYRDYNDRMGDLMQALQMGTQLDISAADDATRRAGIASSAASSASGDATRMRIAELGALADAIGSSVDLTKTGALGMAGLADLMSADQRFALEMVPDLTGMDIRDLESAFGANYALDELGLAERELGSRNANAAADRNWRRYVYDQEQPWNEVLRYGDLVNALTGGYGVSRESGIDQRSVSPYTGSPAGQAVAGGLAGWAMGDEWSQRRAQGNA